MDALTQLFRSFVFILEPHNKYYPVKYALQTYKSFHKPRVQGECPAGWLNGGEEEEEESRAI